MHCKRRRGTSRGGGVAEGEDKYDLKRERKIKEKEGSQRRTASVNIWSGGTRRTHGGGGERQIADG